MKKQLLIAAGIFARRLWMAAALAGTVSVAVCCNDDDLNAERGEFIRVYTDMDDEPVDFAYVDVRGGTASVFVRSNVDYDVFWQDSETAAWIEVVEVKKNAGQGFDEVVLQIDPRQTYSYYTRRTGTLSFSSPLNKLGKFLTIHQGAVARVSQAFTWLAYGSADPLVSDGERMYSAWTQVQKDYVWTTSTPSYCFGKNGYVKLGDDKGNGADLKTVYANDFRSDSLLMVSFRAVAYSDENNVADNKKLTVNILNGGVFPDTGLSTREIQLGTYSVEEGLVAGSMWEDSNYLLFVLKTDESPITSTTQIQFTAGELSQPGEMNSRIFLDNIYIYTLNEWNEGVIEDNGGTDKDIILGVPAQEE